MTKLAEVLKRLPEIKALVAAATPGPWRWRRSQGGGAFLIAETRGSPLILDAVRHGMHGAELRFAVRNPADVGGLMHKANELDLGKHPDSSFLAHARTDVPSLVDALEQAVGLLNEIDSDLCAKWDAENSAKLVRHRIREALGQEPAR